MVYQQIWRNLVEQPLAVLIAAIGAGAIAVTAFSILAPSLSPNVYGVLNHEDYAGEKARKRGTPLPARSQHVLLQSLTIRNAATGITVLLLNSCWQQNVHTNPEKADAILTCLGFVVLVGTIVPIVDCIGAMSAAREQGNNDVGRTAAVVHALRSIVWLIGGIWCLSS